MTHGVDIQQIFDGFDLEVQMPLSRCTSFRVGGPAEAAVFPKTEDELAQLLKRAQTASIPVTLLGGGTNTLVSDQGIKGLVVILTQLKTPSPELSFQNGNVALTAMAGERLSSICRLALENGLSGLEWAAGIPGTLGGAVKMNAGSHGADMSQIITSIGVMDPDTLETITMGSNDLKFTYRSLALGNKIVTKITLLLTRGKKEEIQARYDKNLNQKKNTQPVSKASAGCFFKNPSNEKPAGWLIEQAGLKGLQVNGAMVSKTHANFIINHDNASCSDILALKEKIQNKVYKKFNIRLKTEVKAIGN